ncbi:MAG: CvpA family protein [Sphingobacteriia bacterium]|nr:CvpA family protein [Sphingobacteriia bacterium]NCC38906.1 CvpA family protein [Gammaproteobacteria bacterium]
MSWVDYAIIAVIILSALVGLGRGIIRELLSLGVWIAAVVVAWLFHREVAGLLEPYLSQASVRHVLAFGVLIILTLIAGAVLGALLSAVVDRAGLAGLDRVLGLGFGIARGVVIVAMAVFLAALTPIAEDPWWGESRLIPDAQLVADWLISQVPEDIQSKIKEL